MPVPLLAAYGEMYIRIDAHERLQGIENMGLGFGGYPKHEADKLLSNLAKLTGQEPRKATPTDLARVGVAVKLIQTSRIRNKP